MERDSPWKPQLDPQISQMDKDYQCILHVGHFTLRVNVSQVLIDLQFPVSVPSVSSAVNLNCRI